MMKRTLNSSLAVAIATAALLLSAPHGPARAADASGSFAIHGIGAITCGDLTSGLLEGRTGLRQNLAAWLTGYLSATNRLRADTYDATPIQQPGVLSTMVVNVCLANPDAPVEVAVTSLLDALSVAAVGTESPQQDVAVDGRTVRLRTATLKQLQQALIDRGLMTGTADGAFGATTETAVREFQESAELPVTGLPDPATIVKLLVGDAAAAGQQEAAPSGN